MSAVTTHSGGRRRLPRNLAAAIVVVAAFASLTQVAEAGPRPPVVPSTLQVPTGNRVFLVGHATGVQIYSCNATATGFAWAFVAPRANLYDDFRRLITTHFAGPTWQARDGSSVVGSVVDRATVDPTAIPWLLLSAASTSPGRYGDSLTQTTFIQRTATTGGLAPAAGACSAQTVGARAEVPYTADYHFWKARRPARR